MALIYLALTTFLLLTLVVNIWRVMRGPTVADSILCAQVFGTTALAILLLLSHYFNNPYLQDVALVFALLSAITAVAFVRRAWAGKTEGIDDVD
ncbi:MAG TPA: monovalent cation/H+ antiporter complex subunit F [Marinagarivorans sp.]